MEISVFIFILLIHFLADFGLQTHQQATLKSSEEKFLFYHVGVYSVIWFVAILSYGFAAENALLFTLVTFLFHYLTDWITSRVGKPFWKNDDFHNGFVVVGFDQLLHYIQLIMTWKLITTI
jgi:hypothetical protein